MARIGLGESRAFAAAYLRTMDPELAAQAVGLSDGTALMETEEVQRQLERRRTVLRRQLLPEDVVRMLASLAFGRCNDCVKLILQEQTEIDRLDLRLLSEVKRNDKGTVEIKLVDRLSALQQLAALVSADEETATAFLQALTGAAEAP